MSIAEEWGIGGYLHSITFREEGDKLRTHFPYNKALVSEIRQMSGARWNPDSKEWTIDNNERNAFQRQYLTGSNVYAEYDKELEPLPQFRHKLRENQELLVRSGLTRKRVIWAAEMGLGKTLAWIAVTELLGLVSSEDIWYVGPVSGVVAVTKELTKWGALFEPRMMTYEGFVKVAQQGVTTPKMLCFDEASKIKNPDTKRALAAMHVGEYVREADGHIIEMTGTPAPKSPLDWWSLTEVACPGFLKEGNKKKLLKTLALVDKQESLAGGFFEKINCWLDDERKCAKCGEFAAEHDYLSEHIYEPSVNEVARLSRRLKGLVMVQFKKDWLKELPEVQYEEIRVKPTVEVLRASQLIRAQSPRAATALILLRELGDGFQYTETKTGEFEMCPECFGKKEITVELPEDDPSPFKPVGSDTYITSNVTCPHCGGNGEVPIYKRSVLSIESPKDEVFKNELDESLEIGRYVVWGGFTETVDKLVRLALQSGWTVLRVDGRGYHGFASDGSPVDSDTLLSCMDYSMHNREELMEKYPRVCVVGNASSGGMALTLTASPVMLFYSNSFDGEARMQAEGRHHRMGMNLQWGAMIKDIMYLPTDKLVLDNLKEKKDLQKMSMEQLRSFEGDSRGESR